MSWYKSNVLETDKKAGIYGAEWDGSSSTVWLRTDDAALFAEPIPQMSNGSGGWTQGSSPFDDIMPWAGMVVSEDSNAGTVVAIPKFYFKLGYANETSPRGLKIQISSTPQEGFQVSPAHMDRGDGAGERDVVYVGRYHCGSWDYKSSTGDSPYTSITRATARSTIHNLGSNIWQWDFATRFTIWLLYLVEFADWDSQSDIGYGCGNNSRAQNMGYTDSMPYHTGTTQSSRTTYGLGTQYRHIEGLWDNVGDWLDGAYYNSDGLNIILNPANFSDSSGGIAVGVPSSGYPSAFDVKMVNGTYSVIIPTAKSESGGTTFSCDNWGFASTSPCLWGGGDYYQDLSRGLFCVGGGTTVYASANRGSRLMILP